MSALLGWKHDHDLPDGRQVWKDADGCELIQRPDGEWTHRDPRSPVRAGLGTTDMVEAIARSAWDLGEWKAHLL